MKVAIYARKSTDDDQKTPDNKSVQRQIERSKEYAKTKGWVIDENHIYVDDGISGAEFKNRPGLNRLLNNLREFDVVVMSENSRLGRDMLYSAVIIAEICSKNKRIFYYLTDEEELADTPEQRFMILAKGFAAEVERVKASQRSRDALECKARRGFNTGGSCYGYDNVIVLKESAIGEQTKSHTDYRINPEQSEIILGIFRMYAAGHGYKAIAKALNGDTTQDNQQANLVYFSGMTPDSPRKGTGSWSASAIRSMLYNERYLGKVPFGEFRNSMKGGTKKRIKQESFLQVERPDLCIVPQELWYLVQNRLYSERENYLKATKGQLFGRVDTERESKFLLTGLGVCSICGSKLVVIGGTSGTGNSRRRAYKYGCSYHHNRGNSICENDHKISMSELDEAVLAAIKRQVLSSEAIDYVIDQALEVIRKAQNNSPDLKKKLEDEHMVAQTELRNLINALANGAPASLVAAIMEREKRLDFLNMELNRLKITQLPTRSTLSEAKRFLTEKIKYFDDVISSDIPTARKALRQLLEEPIVFTPVMKDGKKSIAFKGKMVTSQLLAGNHISMASPTGFEPVLPP